VSNIIDSNNNLLREIRSLISEAKTKVAFTINAQMTLLYWSIGKRIRNEVIKNERAEYGKQILEFLSRNLSAEYGNGFSRTSLFKMLQFYDKFTNDKIIPTLSEQLTWSHIVELLPLKSKEQIEFYSYMAIDGKWSVRELRSNINRMTFERTIANQNPKNILSSSEANNSIHANLLLKDPYILDFLNLPENHYERDLESAILAEIEKFILELGTGFSFIARQKRLSIDEDHFYLDLLFYNRRLKRMVAIELKTGKFKPEFKGQMELYLKYLEKYETYDGELSPIGIILCTEKSSHQIELLEPNRSGIHVAEYWTELPPKEVFERKIQEFVLRSQESVLKIKDTKN
jgi:predicted nuclease of restriction endonuclease-like (RecB) superfamily